MQKLLSILSWIYNHCSFAHIPKSLKWNFKRKNNKFYLDEELYWRCKKDAAELPYKVISLADVSVNRQGKPTTPISQPQDVLIDIRSNNAPNYDCGVITMKIKEISIPNTYKKTFTHRHEQTQEEYSVTMELVHRPEPCMFPHSVFQFTFQNKIVTMEDHTKKTGFGSGNQSIRALRSLCKVEMHDMIIKKQVIF